jgi:hypothetical protein
LQIGRLRQTENDASRGATESRRSHNFCGHCYRFDTPPSLRRARLEVVMRLVSRGHMMRISMGSELIAQKVLNWTLAAVATVAMLSKRSSFQ